MFGFSKRDIEICLDCGIPSATPITGKNKCPFCELNDVVKNLRKELHTLNSKPSTLQDNEK